MTMATSNAHYRPIKREIWTLPSTRYAAICATKMNRPFKCSNHTMWTYPCNRLRSKTRRITINRNWQHPIKPTSTLSSKAFRILAINSSNKSHSQRPTNLVIFSEKQVWLRLESTARRDSSYFRFYDATIAVRKRDALASTVVQLSKYALVRFYSSTDLSITKDRQTTGRSDGRPGQHQWTSSNAERLSWPTIRRFIFVEFLLCFAKTQIQTRLSRNERNRLHDRWWLLDSKAVLSCTRWFVERVVRFVARDAGEDSHCYRRERREKTAASRWTQSSEQNSSISFLDHFREPVEWWNGRAQQRQGFHR